MESNAIGWSYLAFMILSPFGLIYLGTKIVSFFKNKFEAKTEDPNHPHPNKMTDSQYIFYLESELYFMKAKTDAFLDSFSTQYPTLDPQDHLIVMEKCFQKIGEYTAKYQTGQMSSTEVVNKFIAFISVVMQPYAEKKNSMKDSAMASYYEDQVKKSLNESRYPFPRLRDGSVVAKTKLLQPKY